MKTTVKLTIKEFLNFREIAKQSNVLFTCVITQGCYYLVTADVTFLEKLGFI